HLHLGLLGVLGDLAPHLDVALRYEVHPLQQVELDGLRKGGGAARREDAFEAGGPDHRARREPGLEELPSIVTSLHTRLRVSEDSLAGERGSKVRCLCLRTRPLSRETP